MEKKFGLGDRVKTYYEQRFGMELMRRTYTLIRIDGKAFHTFTKSFERPFDDKLMAMMDDTAAYLCTHIQGARFAYVQSDEITILLTDFDTHQTQAWFDYDLQKMVSISASMATSNFNRLHLGAKLFEALQYGDNVTEEQIKKFNANLRVAEFDSRVFQVPNRIEAFNAVLFRQQDASRNSISAVAQSMFSAKQLDRKNQKQMQEMIFQKAGINWNDYEPYYKRGRIIKKEGSEWIVDRNIPIFSQERDYLFDLIPKEEEYEPNTEEYA
jgi:tRNA(His) guanylyltransferase